MWIQRYLLLGCSLLFTLPAMGWGFWAHQRINRLAVFTLPPEMLLLYKQHLGYLTVHAVDPDKRRYAVDGEAPRHYIDIDHYGTYPFPELPRDWNAAVEKYSEDTLQAYGIVPYYLPRKVYQLRDAFQSGDLEAILKISADLGHYVGDAHVPLHTTKNYNGQLTGQRGIHGFWESRLPELFAINYDFFVGRAYYISDLDEEAWYAVLGSHRLVDSVLRIEKEVSARFPADRKYGYESRNEVAVRTYSREYSAAYHEALNGMVERRMREAIRAVGAYWYTAWKMAGSPDLRPLLGREVEETPLRYERKLDIVDREAYDVGLFWRLPRWQPDPCCMRGSQPAARPFGLVRTQACVGLQVYQEPAWYQKAWRWLADRLGW